MCSSYTKLHLGRLFDALDEDGSESLSHYELQDLDYSLQRQWGHIEMGSLAARVTNREP